MKKPSNFQLFKLVAIVMVTTALAVFIYFRGIDFKDCVMASYDLKRDTDFRVLTGACTTKGKDGSLIYVKQLRGFGDDGDDSHD